jgi:alginate O-acetyltransferase complex protein AlgI
MIFGDIRFFALFLGCWISFFALPRRWRPAVLAVWGAAFYSLYAGRFVFVVVALAVLVLFSGSGAVIPWLAGIVIVALLAFFKLTSAAGVLPQGPANPVAILIPLGFSYLAFELLHVVIDRRRGRIETVAWAELLAFVFFAPARVAGPIKRFPDFTAAVRDAELSGEDLYAGILRVLIGFAKKFFIADMLASTVSEGSYFYSMGQVWTIVLAYSFQIYFDFSAYSDIAIGFARTLGIRLPENFDRPYFAKNIREFWDRWHMTLSRWVGDYIFMPAGRRLFQTRMRRWPIAIAVVSYLTAFTIVGAWHGLTVPFLLWGLYHGVILSLYHVIRLKTPPWLAGHLWYRSRAADAMRVAVTFLCVTVGWVPFMLPLKDAERVLALMFGF